MVVKLFVRQYCCFLDTVHSFADFKVDETFRIKKVISNAVFIENIFSDVAAMKTHVPVDVHD